MSELEETAMEARRGFLRYLKDNHLFLSEAEHEELKRLEEENDRA